MTTSPQNAAPALAQFTARLAFPAPGAAEAADLLAALAAEGSSEEAYFRFRQARRQGSGTPSLGSGWEDLRPALESAAAAGRRKRTALWHLATERLHLRLRYARRRPLQDLNPAGTLAQLCRTLEAAGLALALGLGKSPRPLVTLGHPLPLGTEGLEEWADLVLSARPPGGPAEWTAAFNTQAPEGLQALGMEVVPAYAAPVLDLAARAHWVWTCPPDLLETCRARVDAFLRAETFEIERAGKSEGQKTTKRTEVRSLVLGAEWAGPELRFVLRIAPGEALNPRKLLGGILGLDPASLEGLVRTRVELREDRRLQQADRFEPKLHNIFEDAVVLGAGSNITLVEEDDEEPLHLG